ncbi:MAG: hypothetical protein IH845_02230 [Nanoarchaeota archaeon]|nr:hypothetical protein [Nanoarchaeota archaeon]
MKWKRGQIAFEYLVIIGFVTLVITAILGISITYTNSLRDNVNINQMEDFANKIISTSEYVFYAGNPSKSTITVYLPDNIKGITIIENTIYFDIETGTGINKIGYPSAVNISGSITNSPGIKQLEIEALVDHVSITQK